MTDLIIKITPEDRTSLVDALLKKLEQCDLTIEDLINQIRSLKEENQLLKDEIARLKGTSKRPNIKPGKKHKPAPNPKSDDDKRAGSAKVSKKSTMEIHDIVVVTPQGLPEGSRLRRRRQFDVQDLVLKAHNTRFVLEEWEDPTGNIHSAQLPSGIANGHFGHGLCAFILNQHHQCQVTQPLLHEQLTEFGIDISTGQLNNILTENKEIFHNEKDQLLVTGLEISKYIQTDDTGARHDGKNGYCNNIGNEFFAWFHSSHSKSRINFLTILSSAYKSGYLLTEDAYRYMQIEGLPKKPFEILKNAIQKTFPTESEWKKWLNDARIIKKRHVKIATEAALLAGCFASGMNRDLIILSDDAGQFNIPMLRHALCWVHEERHLQKLVPGNNEAKAKDLENVINDFWLLYAQLKIYKRAPSEELAASIELAFNELFTRKTTFESLNSTLKLIFAKKAELLQVLQEPSLPLHNNGSETDIREFVKRRKVSGGTRSTLGQQCRDTFASLKKTCRKLGVSFYAFLKDRQSGTNAIPPLSELMKKAASQNTDSMALGGTVNAAA